MKIMTVLGTRPEIIRLSLVTPMLDAYAEHVLVHTGQNFDDGLSGIFFRELGVRDPNVHMGVRADSFGEQVGQIISRSEALFLEHRPDRVLILGDTNSGLCAVVARRLGIPVYHMEAGNRCFDDRVPEEVNRRVIDHSSTILLPYTEGSRANLLREGIESHRIFVTGNPIKQVLDHNLVRIEQSDVLDRLHVERRRFFLVTMHRAENVDREDALRSLLTALVLLHERYGFPVVCSLHPRTRSKAARFGLPLDAAGVRFVAPLGFFDFVRLEQEAFCVLSDSGTVQEEACILRVPNVTIRNATERPETIECGSNILASTAPERIMEAVHLVTSRACNWSPPPEYAAGRVAETVCNIVLGYRAPDPAELEWRARSRA
jgi:UDP-N-acetylglucosamine 2-epimerase (non-hydrolysing)